MVCKHHSCVARVGFIFVVSVVLINGVAVGCCPVEIKDMGSPLGISIFSSGISIVTSIRSLAQSLPTVITSLI